MVPWEIWVFVFEVEGDHPAVILNNPVRVATTDMDHRLDVAIHGDEQMET